MTARSPQTARPEQQPGRHPVPGRAPSSPPASGTQASGITQPAGTASPAAATRSRGARNQPANQARDVREVAAAGTTLAAAEPRQAALSGEAWRKAAKAAASRQARPRTAAAVKPVGVPGGVTLTATAHCLSGCGWTAGPGPAAEVDRAAEKHVRSGHPTVTAAEPARGACK